MTTATTTIPPLNASQEAIYLAIRDKGLLRKPDPMKAPVDGRNRFKYCDFHKDVGHNTSEYYSLRNQIEGLVRGGLLAEFLQRVRDSIKEGKQVQNDMWEAAKRRREGEKDLMQQIQVINMISGGPTLAGTSHNSRKNHVRKIPRFNTDVDVLRVSNEPRDLSHSIRIVFTKEDVYNTVQPLMTPWSFWFRSPIAGSTVS